MNKLPPLYWIPSDASKKTDAETMYHTPASTMRPGFYDVEPTQENARAGALRAADWFLRHQVNTAENLSGDTGRYYGIRGLYDNALYLTQNWLAAHCVVAELAAFHATGNEAYRTSARLGGEYLLGLQVLDARLPKALGTYREHHARFPIAGARSGCSVVWAMVQLFKATEDQEYLDSAKMYARWFLDQAFPKNVHYPAGEYYISEDRWVQTWTGCYMGGVAGIFHQLYLLTKDQEILDRLVIQIAAGFIKFFLQPDGSRTQAIDWRTGKPCNENLKSFHVYNDDFAGLGLLAAYKETKDKKFLEASQRMARWLAERTEPSGRLGGVVDASATALVHFLAHTKMTGTTELNEPMRRFVKFLLRQQVVDIASAEFHGGLRGQSHVRGADESGHYIDARATSYAICGLLGYADPQARILLEVE